MYVMSAVMFMTQKSAIQTTASHQELLLKNYQKTGNAHFVALVKINFQKNKKINTLWTQKPFSKLDMVCMS